MKGKTFFGTNNADTISIAASNAAVNGRGGNDSISGGSGNDTLYGGAGNDLFVCNVGKDVIEDYGNGTDKISVDSALTYVGYKLEGTDVVLNYGEGNSLTVKNGKNKTITINSVAKVYGEDGTFDSVESAIANHIETESNGAIDGSATGAIEIIGNGGGSRIAATNSTELANFMNSLMSATQQTNNQRIYAGGNQLWGGGYAIRRLGSSLQSCK